MCLASARWMTGNVASVHALYTCIGWSAELNTCTHARVTERRARVRQLQPYPLGLFRSKGRLHDWFEGGLLYAHTYTHVKSIVHGNLKPFAESARVVRTWKGHSQSASTFTGNHENFQQDTADFVRIAEVGCDKYHNGMQEPAGIVSFLLQLPTSPVECACTYVLW